MQECISPEDVMKLAIQIEETGRTIYENTQNQAQAPELIELFRFLAEEETKHIDTFQRIYENFLRGGSQIKLPNPEDTFFLKTLAENQIFQGKDKALNLVKTATEPLQLINYALAFERDALLFFMKLYRMVCAQDRELISQLIKEEEGHIVKLTEIQYRLKTPKPKAGIFGKE